MAAQMSMLGRILFSYPYLRSAMVRFPLLFPMDSEYLKSLDIGLWEVGAKRRLNGVNK